VAAVARTGTTRGLLRKRPCPDARRNVSAEDGHSWTIRTLRLHKLATKKGKNAKMHQTIKQPAECSACELESFKEMVVEAGQVCEAGLERRIEHAHLLTFQYDESKLVAVAGLKHPEDNYRRRVFRNAGVSELADNYGAELGWVVTLEEYRGQHIGSRLVQNLLERTESRGVFATTKTDNRQMQAILIKNGFRECGEPYEGRCGTYQLQLYLHEASGRMREGVTEPDVREITKFFSADWKEVSVEEAAYAVKLTFDGDRLVKEERFVAKRPEDGFAEPALLGDNHPGE
jgi:ribosomal protein S18 acetylase RimI-like enzyme